MVSHGICESCAAIFLKVPGVPLQAFIEGLAVPIVVIDGNFRLRAFNQAAEMALGKTAGDTLEQLPGKVFDCENSRLSGGCGKTIHCSGCAIRLAIEETYRTGRPQMDVRATLIRPSTSSADASLFIHTFRAGDAVVLRVDGL